VSLLFLALFILRPWRWWRRVPTKHRFNFSGLHGVILENRTLQPLFSFSKLVYTHLWVCWNVLVLNPFLIHMKLKECIANETLGSCWNLPCLVVFYLIHIYQTIRGSLQAEEWLHHPAICSLAWRVTVTNWPARLYLWENVTLKRIALPYAKCSCSYTKYCVLGTLLDDSFYQASLYG
jgi:hypothetical protein